ncbi:hypothetical protein BC629DRAFT_1445774 [Irpex lacteus]|nr:hypothetical protein BC629DRAFT_1445774 [Irpex lacteus]
MAVCSMVGRGGRRRAEEEGLERGRLSVGPMSSELRLCDSVEERGGHREMSAKGCCQFKTLSCEHKSDERVQRWRVVRYGRTEWGAGAAQGMLDNLSVRRSVNGREESARGIMGECGVDDGEVIEWWRRLFDDTEVVFFYRAYCELERIKQEWIKGGEEQREREKEGRRERAGEKRGWTRGTKTQEEMRGFGFDGIG